jgi:DNA-binding NarL/FixJ family response regulator
MTIAALIVDDHGLFRTNARALLEAGGVEVVGEAADGAGALEAVHALRPTLVLLDVQLPDMTGFEVAERLAAADAPPAVILVSTRAAEDYGPRLRRAPACGFIQKSDLEISGILALLERAS